MLHGKSTHGNTFKSPTVVTAHFAVGIAFGITRRLYNPNLCLSFLATSIIKSLRQTRSVKLASTLLLAAVHRTENFRYHKHF
jgi:hypothetical protein